MVIASDSAMIRSNGRRPHADIDRDGCLAPASQRRRSHFDLARSKRREFGATIEFLSPDGFPSVRVPTYPGLRLALPGPREIAKRIEQTKPDAIHIETEGTIGVMTRAWCLRKTAGRSRRATPRDFPNIFRALAPSRKSWIYAALRRFHGGAAVTMVATPSLTAELSQRGFRNLGMWTRGVDTDLFSPIGDQARSAAADLHQRRAHRRREKPGGVSFTRSAGHQGGVWCGSAGGGAAATLPRGQIPRQLENGQAVRAPRCC